MPRRLGTCAWTGPTRLSRGAAWLVQTRFSYSSGGRRRLVWRGVGSRHLLRPDAIGTFAARPPHCSPTPWTGSRGHIRLKTRSGSFVPSHSEHTDRNPDHPTLSASWAEGGAGAVPARARACRSTLPRRRLTSTTPSERVGSCVANAPRRALRRAPARERGRAACTRVPRAQQAGSARGAATLARVSTPLVEGCRRERCRSRRGGRARSPRACGRGRGRPSPTCPCRLSAGMRRARARGVARGQRGRGGATRRGESDGSVGARSYLDARALRSARLAARRRHRPAGGSRRMPRRWKLISERATFRLW